MNEEMIAKAKQAKSVEELLALAKENNIEISEEQVKKYFDRLHATGELADDELDNVAGGGCGDGYMPKYSFCGKCMNPSCRIYNQIMDVPEKNAKCPICGQTMSTWEK